MNDTISELQARRQYAALLMNYSCTIACDHCCFDCSPGKPDVVMEVNDAAGYLRELHRLGRLVHIAGGEPFRYYERLRAIIDAAGEAGCVPHFVESNCSWCGSEDLTRQRMGHLKERGVLWMLISTDQYHLKHVPAERVIRGVRIAEEVFGEGTTMGRDSPEAIRERAKCAKDPEKLEAHVRNHPPMLVGRAKKVLATFVPDKPLDELQLETGWGRDPDNTCKADWDPLWEIHVDPYGNVQTNCGILLGNAKKTPIAELIRTWPDRNPILKRLSQRGVAALLDMALERGFSLKDAYPQKCFLCAELRGFLRNRDDEFKRVFGPDEVYEA